jgi:hypothetical protein
VVAFEDILKIAEIKGHACFLSKIIQSFFSHKMAQIRRTFFRGKNLPKFGIFLYFNRNCSKKTIAQ